MIKNNYPAVWFRGLSDQEKDDLKEILDRDNILLDKLREIVYNMVKEVETVNLGDYDSPSWSHKQAHNNGMSQMARRVIDLITPKERQSET